MVVRQRRESLSHWGSGDREILPDQMLREPSQGPTLTVLGTWSLQSCRTSGEGLYQGSRVPEADNVRSGVSFLGLLHQQRSRAVFCSSRVFKVSVGSKQLLLPRQIRAAVHDVPIMAQPAQIIGVALRQHPSASRTSRSVIGGVREGSTC